MAVQWGLSNPDKSLKIAKQSYVRGNIHSNPEYDYLLELPRNCVESADELLEHRDIFEREDVFPPYVIDFIARQLQNENDKNLNERLKALPDEEKLKESRRIMHRDLHKN